MSDLEVNLTQREMEESGELDFIRQHVAAAQGEAAPAEAEADTVVETDEEVVEEDVTPDGDTDEVTPDGDTELSAEEEEVLYLELDDDTQALIDTKYGGDLNKALAALSHQNSLLGRQGSELGDLRKQMEELTAAVQKGQTMSQPYSPWPDEFDEPVDAAKALRTIAEEAFAREDLDTFSNAVDAWVEVNAPEALNYRDLKILQLQRAAVQPPAPAEDTLEKGIAAVQEKYPQFGQQEPAFMEAFDAELQKFPTLRALLWGEIPGTTPDQRLAALDETVGRVASQQVAETEQTARRRVAVKRSEEARKARQEATVTSGETARVVEDEKPARKIPMGESGKMLDIDKLNAMLPESDRL